MKAVPLFLPILLASSLAAQSQPPSAKSAPHDWLVVPGVRVGPITAKTKKSDLKRLFGAKNVVHKELPLEGGLTTPGSVIYGFFPERRLEIIWYGPQTSGTTIEMCPALQQGRQCEWKTAQGLTIGTDLKTVERINGRPFLMAAFSSENPGGANDWQGGRLASHNLFSLIFAEAEDRVTSQEAESLRGSQEIPSSDPVLQKMNPRVIWMREDWNR